MDNARADIVVNQAGGEAAEAAYAPVVSRVASCLKIRLGTADDLAWIDELQKANRRAVGFLPTGALAGKLKLGQILVATVMGKRAGYLIAADRYAKRDEVGLVTQMCVEPIYRRSLVAAALLQAQFDRSAYGCRLFSCWCAQDLVEASRFWEAMGFVPIAFRSGAVKQGEAAGDGPRVHIFWQKRVRAGDDVTPWWYPCKTEGGVLRSDRIALPIPPGTHWSEVRAVQVPEVQQLIAPRTPDAEPIEERVVEQAVDRVTWPKGIEERDGKLYRGDVRLMTVAMIKAEQGVGSSGMWFMPDGVEVVASLPEPTIVKAKRKKPRVTKAKAEKVVMTVDPAFVAMSRELRDRWMEAVDADPQLVASSRASHDVRRHLVRRDQRPLTLPGQAMKALPMAA